MNTNKFLRHYLSMEARVTICNDRGSILYEGRLGDVPARLTNYYTKVKSVEGLGSQDDLIITVTKEN